MEIESNSFKLAINFPPIIIVFTFSVSFKLLLFFALFSNCLIHDRSLDCYAFLKTGNIIAIRNQND